METDTWPFVPAKFFQKGSPGRFVRLVCIHSTESLETKDSAENVARYFQTTSRPASAHVVCDADSIIQCVRDSDIPAAAPGANRDGMHIEICGKANQSEADWLDPYSILALNNAANVCAQYCQKFYIPVKHLSNAELLRGDRGIVGHYQVSEVYKKSTHTDPGKHFVWQFFLERVKAFYDARKVN
jgi:N-acetylmuramoyl-L-alanine amidase CwlA